MAKISKKKRNDTPSITAIYEILSNQNVIQKLWTEIISDIGNKPTYKHIKEKVKCAINETLSDFDTEPADNSDLLRRRAAFTEISIMAYTVDRIISESLYRRLHKEFKKMIGSMLEEFQTEKKVKRDPSPSKTNSMFENIEEIFTKKEQSKDEGTSNIQQVEANQKPARKRGRPKKSATHISPSSSRLPLNKINETTGKSDESDTFKEKDSDQDSNLTFASLSSVHTTDLDSFDDNVSICTDDGKNGRRKKQLSVQKVNEMFLKGNLPAIYQIETNVEINKRKREAASRKVLPQRKRKPNSRYNSETMYCQVKDYSSPRDSSISGEASEGSSSEASEETTSTESVINQEAKRAKISNNKNEHVSPTKAVTTRSNRNGSPTKDAQSQDIPVPASSSTPLKNTAQSYTSSDLYKPRFHFGSSCSNRSATAFTIFS